MIPDPPPNGMARPYRGLSVQEVDVPLDERDLLPFLLGREVYRRSDYLALRRGEGVALVAVRRHSDEPLFAPVADARLLAGPDEVVWVHSPTTDVGNATALARAALAHRRPGARAYLVQGRYEHVNFIWDPSPVRIRVTEVVPPEPAKLLAMAEQAVAFDEELPPVELVLDAVDVRELAAGTRASHFLLPCRGSGVDLTAPVSFLDTRPAHREDWLLIGCERSLQFHRHFYGDEPEQLDLCPRRRVTGAPADPILTMTKCCLLERGVETGDGVAVVPWGANLDEVRLALRHLTGLAGRVTTAREAVHAYVGAWNQPDEAARRRLLERSCSDDVSYTDPSVHLVGRAALVGHARRFAERWPGAEIVVTGPIDEHHQRWIRFRWRVVGAGGAPLRQGVDFAELDGDGRLRRVVGFFDLDPASPPGAAHPDRRGKHASTTV